MDRGPWWATVRGVAQSQTRPKSLSTHTHARVCLFRRINLRFCLLFQWVIFLVSFFLFLFSIKLAFFFPASCLENPMDGGAWWAAVHGVAKSQTQLSDFTFTFHFHALEKEMATQSSVLAWRIPGTGEPGGLLSKGSHRIELDWNDLAAAGEKLVDFTYFYISLKTFKETFSSMSRFAYEQ